ncbi:MAG: hypothetical protein Q8O66_00290 [bacterium]|nr:hypothetical protein [bacterium]
MAFKTIYQLKTKRLWWVDVLLYFSISLLVVTVLCYFIFNVKNSSQKESIKELNTALESVGTSQQKGFEREVTDYQKKVDDFMALLKNRKFVSTVFGFMEQQTFFNIWFDKFAMNRKDAEVSLSGKAENMAAFSRQVSIFEKNEYIKKITVLNSRLGNSGTVEFNLNITMDQKIFDSSLQSSLLEVTTSSEQIFNTTP